MSISYKDLLSGHPIADVPMKHQQNLQELLKRVNPVLQAFGAQSYLVTSGYRSLQDHLRIYSQKGISRANIPMKSAHLSGEAVDIFDDGLMFTHWLQNDKLGITMLEKQELYCEAGNKNWVHFTTRRPGSGKRWFLP